MSSFNDCDACLKELETCLVGSSLPKHLQGNMSHWFDTKELALHTQFLDKKWYGKHICIFLLFPNTT